MLSYIKKIEKIIDEEVELIKDQYGTNYHTDHEAYAILKEEFDETQDELRAVSSHLESLWEFVKHDYMSDRKIKALQEIKKKAILTACEAVQVAAVAQKSVDTLIDKMNKKYTEREVEEDDSHRN